MYGPTYIIFIEHHEIRLHAGIANLQSTASNLGARNVFQRLANISPGFALHFLHADDHLILRGGLVVGSRDRAQGAGFLGGALLGLFSRGVVFFGAIRVGRLLLAALFGS